MTGLIYVILISLWGVVLVPRWLRHHDESRRRRESQRVERALNPHSAISDDSQDRSDYQSWREYLRSLTRRDAVQWESIPLLDALRSPRGQHARRRRSIVIVLAGLTGVCLLGAVVGVLPGLLAVSSTLLLGGYVSAMILQLRRWESNRRPETVAATPNSRDLSSHPFQMRDGVRVVSNASDVGSQWSPQESTLPIYATKSKASKIPRRIDLTHQGWTGADMVEQARAQQSPLHSQFDREFAALEPEVDEQVAELANYRDEYYRRAVNE